MAIYCVALKYCFVFSTGVNVLDFGKVNQSITFNCVRALLCVLLHCCSHFSGVSINVQDLTPSCAGAIFGESLFRFDCELFERSISNHCSVWLQV